MTKAKQHLLISLAIFAVAFGAVIILIATSASGAVKAVSEVTEQIKAPTVEPVQSEPKFSGAGASEAIESAPEPVQIMETYSQPSVTPNAQQEQQKEPQLERIPFTNKPVTAGDPESYVDTYGQCPFYENAGPKGCVPPPDIQCNEDWSKCEYVGAVND